MIHCGDGMGREYPNPLGMGLGFNFASMFGMCRVTGKYMRVGDGDETYLLFSNIWLQFYYEL